MRSNVAKMLVVVALVSTLARAQSDPVSAGSGARGTVNWPQFRGPRGGGVSEGYATPSRWDATNSTNVKWKTPIPGLGHSSPIIWGDRLFVTTAISTERDPELKVGLYGNVRSYVDDSIHAWKVFCLDKNDGRILWERVAHKGVPRVRRHPKATHANSTPATDGKHLVVLFGSEGLYCYDMEGKLLWKKGLGVLDAGYRKAPEMQWEFASSPVIFDGKVIIQADIRHGSFLTVLDVRNGKEIWRVDRNDVPTWSTPAVHVGAGRTQIVVNGYRHIGGYDLRNGKELWKVRGGGDRPVPTPVVADDLIYITNSHGAKSPIYAIYADAEGEHEFEKKGSHSDGIAWGRANGGNGMQTPIVYRGYLFTCRDNGTLTIFDAVSGEAFTMDRFGFGRTAFTASPVAADDKVYFTSEEGDVFVIEAQAELGVISINHMGETCLATPAISQGRIYIRGRRHLFCIAE